MKEATVVKHTEGGVGINQVQLTALSTIPAEYGSAREALTAECILSLARLYQFFSRSKAKFAEALLLQALHPGFLVLKAGLKN